jgi:hypothetical protein
MEQENIFSNQLIKSLLIWIINYRFILYLTIVLLFSDLSILKYSYL